MNQYSYTGRWERFTLAGDVIIHQRVLDLHPIGREILGVLQHDRLEDIALIAVVINGLLAVIGVLKGVM